MRNIGSTKSFDPNKIATYMHPCWWIILIRLERKLSKGTIQHHTMMQLYPPLLCTPLAADGRYHTHSTILGRVNHMCASPLVNWFLFLHDRLWISLWMISTSNELGINVHVLAFQFSGNFDVISNRLGRCQQNVRRTSERRSQCV